MGQDLIVMWLTGLTALIHFIFAGLEIGAWRMVSGRLLGYDDAMANRTRPLGLNQGVYNLFLAAGLTLTLLQPQGLEPMRMFLLGCVVVAGLIGQITIGRPNLFLGLQAFPAMIALIASGSALS